MAFVEARLNAAIDAVLNGVGYAQLHTGPPGAAGTANVAAGVARCALSGVGGASGKSDTLTGSWTIPGAGGPYTHMTLWTAATGGALAEDGATLTPAESFAGAGTLNLTATVAAS